MIARYFVGLGANLGDRLATISAAARALAETTDVELRASSSVWESRAVGPGTRPFFNAAVELHASLPPLAMLAALLAVEAGLGRVRRERWGDRTIDLDLVCAHELDGARRELTLRQQALTLPHPRAAERDFVLRPLVELDRDLVLGGRRCREQLTALADPQRTLVARRAVAIPGL